jgi:hypothetical protein
LLMCLLILAANIRGWGFHACSGAIGLIDSNTQPLFRNKQAIQVLGNCCAHWSLGRRGRVLEPASFLRA